MFDELYDQRVLVLAWIGRDGALTCELLRQEGISAQICRDVLELCRMIEQGVGAIVAAEEGLLRHDPQPLMDMLQRQPEWSDIPLIILAPPRSDRADAWELPKSLGEKASVTLLERPVRPWTMLSTVRAALRARHRQYEVREALQRWQLAEDQLRRREAILQEAGRMAQLGAWEIEVESQQDLNANPLHWSEQVYRIFGYEPGSVEVSNEFFFRHVPSTERQGIIAAIAAAIAKRAAYSLVHRILRADGEERIVEEHAQIIFGEQGQPLRILGAVQDITERVKGEEELAAARRLAEQAREAAEEASRAKDQFLAMLSHELRTPLAPVTAAISLLQTSDIQNGEKGELLEMVRRNIELESQLIDDLLDMTRVLRGKVDLDCQSVPLCRVLGDAIAVCRPDIEARGIDFTVDMGPQAPYLIKADTLRLQQVFWNLLKNAVKFTPHGGQIAVRCWVAGSDQVVAEVRDNGIGIEAEALTRIFKPFEQAERATSRRFGGLGLGLAISKAMVDLHGGSITAESRGIGQGAAFRVTLPVLALGKGEVTIGPDGLPAGKAAQNRTVLPPLRVLLVEDHGDTARIMRRLLAAAGHSVTHAGDVATALETVAANRAGFDLLISDLGLPDASGHELMRRLKEKGYTLPGIVISGYGTEADVQQSRAAGFCAHLTKPVSVPHLEAAMAAATREPSAATQGSQVS